MKLKISDVGVDDNGTLGMSYTDDEGQRDLRFGLPERFVPATDLIALSICTLAGQKYDTIEFDLPITDRMRKQITEIARAEVVSPRLHLPQSAPAGRNTALNFSGGFDSLAAMALMSEPRKLVSLDFGGAFEREQKFFSKFDTVTIKTNFRNLGLARNHWTFMGIGPILLRDYLEIDTYSFGSILEASPWNLKQRRYANMPQPVFGAAGLKQFNPVLGLTEVGTVMILAKHTPELLLESLNSLASPGSEKLNRKIVLLNIVQRLFDDDFGVSVSPDSSGPFINFGTNLASDFLSLYMLKKGGQELTEKLVSGIPEEVEIFISSRSMDFYEKMNTIFADSWKTETKRFVSNKLYESGITPYLESDWVEYRETVDFLSTWHGALQTA